MELGVQTTDRSDCKRLFFHHDAPRWQKKSILGGIDTKSLSSAARVCLFIHKRFLLQIR